ncbi:efflux RND transporter periplasmic adaptor subunit [Roseisalinus antarcticus]|uniref:Efflux pump periplasmic linker BepF n=1 Tax=Roseisalinus antarcticus TaxID=254357 RepID=A0A1Y5SE02_9RHOB|nr:efflux RND transporter periplasmic adaptor subunit [Roseisalinus antarcticus]SLN37835.1 Efflux pump periplasmic linker BepF [Roseisalinus antarcticus]
MTRIAPALLALSVAALPAAAQDREQADAEVRPRPVISEIATPAAGISSSWIGTVSASQEIVLGFVILGTLADRPASLGDTVAEGDVLARLDSTDLDAELRAAEAGVTIAEAEYQTASAAAERARELLSRGVDSEVAVQTAENQLAAAEARLEQARASLARARDARAFATLKAPSAGVITEISAEPGATLSAGDPVLTLAARGAREVLIGLAEEDATTMPDSAAFDISLVSNPGQTTTGTLFRIDPMSERSTRTRTAHLALPGDAPVSFRLGALVNAARDPEGQGMLSLPRAAVIGDAEAPAVWVITGPDRTLRRTPVTLGPEGGGRIAVLDGLAEGEEVLTRGVHSVTQGQRVGPVTSPEAIR